MRKAIIFFCLILSFLVILNTCVEPEEKPSQTPEIFFDNTGGICDVSVYKYFPISEGTFITKVPAG